MKIELLLLKPEDMAIFKKDMQEAFQKGAMSEFADLDTMILQEEDINHSLLKEGSVAYKAVLDGQIVGGTIAVINKETQNNHIDFLYVKYGMQGKGVGKQIWHAIETLYPNTKVWETYTPYFEKRNLHFYINQCGFHAVEFFNPHHKDPQISDDMIGGDYFFRFEKVMK